MDDADFVGESDGDTEEEVLEPLMPPPVQQQALYTPPQRLELDEDVLQAILSPVKLSEPQTTGLEPSSSLANDIRTELLQQDTALDTSTDGMREELAELVVEERPDDEQLVAQDVGMNPQEEPVAPKAGDNQTTAVFSEGDLVEVQSRTWPGINKPGGSGRIVRVHQETDESGQQVAVYDVRYVLGGLERRIEREYVELSSILHERADARKPVGRIFYHDEYAPDKQKKTREVRTTASAPHELRGVKRKRSQRNNRPPRVTNDMLSEEDDAPMSDSSANIPAGDGDSSEYEDDPDSDREAPSRPRLDDRAFILQANSNDPTRKAKANGERHNVNQQSTSQTTQRRVRPIIESDDDEDDDDDNDGDEIRLSDRVRADDLANESYSKADRSLADSSNSQKKSRRPRKKQHYVGGYAHDGDDADANFIQPEDNANSLPDDVAREIRLNIKGKSVTELLALMHQNLALFKQNIAIFESEKSQMKRKLRNLNGLNDTDMREVYEEMTRLDKFLVATLIHEGEDVMNIIIQRLTKKNVSLADAIELEFDGLKGTLNSLGGWFKKAKDLVNEEWFRRDRLHPFTLATSDFASDESISEVPVSTRKYTRDNAVEMDNLNLLLGEGSKNPSHRASFSASRQPSSISQRDLSSLRQSTTKNLAPSTMLDNYDFVQFAKSRQSRSQKNTSDFRTNLRFMKRSQPKAISDPRWNWLKIAKQKQRRASQSLPSNRSIVLPGSRSSPKTKKRFEDSVQEKRFQLRNRRYQTPSTGTHHRKAQTVPNLFQYPEERQIYEGGATTYDHELSVKSVPSAPVFRKNETLRKMPPAEGQTKSSSTNQLDWSSIFEFVYREFEDIVMFPLSPDQRLKCAKFGHHIFPQVPDILREALDVDDRYGVDVDMTVTTSRIRQKLSEIRFSEQEFIHLLMDRQKSGDDIEDRFKTFPEWISLVAMEEELHVSLANWAARALETSTELPIAQLIQHLGICVFEISQTLRSLPDCNFLFSTPQAEYVFFFEVADREAKTTPVLSAIMRTYWYCVQTITALKSSCDKREIFSKSDKEGIDSVFSELLPMRVILATARFLVDLYLYMPASHRWNDIWPSQRVDETSAVSSIPAISLWILLFDCFDSGKWSLQHANSLSHTNEKDFWALLQTMHRHRFLEQLAISFVRGESCGGYLHEIDNGNKNNTDPNQDELNWTSQLLALESAWDLCFILSNACASSTHILDERSITSGNEARWTFVKDLLHPGKPHFLPFVYQADSSIQVKDDFATYSQTYKELVLQRILLLSKLWLPRSDIVELLLDVAADTEQSLSLSKFVRSFLVLCEQLSATSWDRMSYVESIPMESSDPTESICKIILVMLMKLEKRIDQLRFRKAILAAIDSRHKKFTDGINPDIQPSSVADTHTKTSMNWNWGGSQPVLAKASSHINNSTKRGSQQARAKPQTRLLASVLLVVAVADMSYDVDNGKDKRNKLSKGNWGFYCKELTKLLSMRPELGSLCELQSLYVMGTLAMKKSTEYAIIFSSMNDHLKSSILALRESNCLLSKNDKKLMEGTISAALQLFRDLTLQLSQLDQSTHGNSYDVSAIESSISFVLNSGLELCFDAAIDKDSIISVKQLNVAISILQLLHPQAKDQPAQSLNLNVVNFQPVQEVSEFGEFDDLDDSIWASVNLDMPNAASASTPVLQKFTDTFSRITVQSILSHLRGAVQRLVFHYPLNGQSTAQELYAIDLLGAMISTCTIPFSWNMRTFAAVKSRFLAPRLLSAVLKYHSDKDWFSTSFLSEPGAAQLLASMWLTGTLDIQSLLSSPCRIEEVDASYSLQKSVVEKFTEINLQASKQIRYANYWLMLSDGIIFNILRENSVVRYKTDPLLLQLLQKTALTSKLVHEIRQNGEPSELPTLLDIHLDLFRSFCDGCGNIWRSLALNPSANRASMNQFRSQMLDLQSGIFVSLTEVYDINLKMVSQFLDESMSEGWNALSAKFLEEFSAPRGTTSYHSIDESTEPLKERKRFRLLVLLFKFMYANVDCFLFYCGEMATGQQNIFFTIIEMMFRQARCADFPQAQLRFHDVSTADTTASTWSKPQRKSLLRTSATQAGEISPACESFVENVRLFFARQKYPSLFHWFAQNLEHYQTLGMGWRSSKMRILLLNVLDPLGPLGIDSYYPIQVEVDLDVGGIKREAFYLACGLFVCNHGATSYQHCRAAPHADALIRMQKMRTFTLNDFMWETFNYAQSVDKLCVLETLVPVCQFIRAVLSHCNLNCRDEAAPLNGTRPFHFDIAEIYPCMESIALFFVKALKPDTVLESVISCVLLIELSGIAIEALIWTEKSFNGQASQLLELIVMYFGSVYKMLKRSSSCGLDSLFGPNTDQAYLGSLLKHFPSTSIFDEVLSIKAETTKSALRNTYGISEARVRSDLLSAIRRLVVQCQKSSNEFIRNLVAQSAAHPLLGSTT